MEYAKKISGAVWTISHLTKTMPYTLSLCRNLGRMVTWVATMLTVQISWRKGIHRLIYDKKKITRVMQAFPKKVW